MGLLSSETDWSLWLNCDQGVWREMGHLGQTSPLLHSPSLPELVLGQEQWHWPNNGNELQGTMTLDSEQGQVVEQHRKANDKRNSGLDQWPAWAEGGEHSQDAATQGPRNGREEIGEEPLSGS